MGKDFSTLENSNRSRQPSIHEVSQMRRQCLRGGAAGALATLLAPLAGWAGGSASGALLGFEPIAPSAADRIVVPPGYVAEVLAAWGDPVGIGGPGPAFRQDAGNSATEQALQLGMHHDGMQFFALGAGRGLLALNHEYTDEALLHGAHPTDAAERVRKSQAAHGVSVLEVRRQADGRWHPVRPSRYARRITASTPIALGGPAAGHRLMRTAADPAGRRVLGTFNNCAAGRTPWGTYLTGEENFAGYFH
ncbi:MAG: Tat pathway signal protein, partial [Burkholderiales bacterium PBB5]